jgi:hypothetical protein
LLTTGTIFDIFENLGTCLILAQSTGTLNAFNPKIKIKTLMGNGQLESTSMILSICIEMERSPVSAFLGAK